MIIKKHTAVLNLAVGAFALTLHGPTCSAQPAFIRQPGNASVRLGDNATFSAAATGAGPITYQWRSEAGDLVGATNLTLVVSNVTLDDLGGYTVVARNAYGARTSRPGWLRQARWTELVVFGDSMCMAQYSDGKSWVEYLGELAGFSGASGIRNYATGGAGCATVNGEIGTYLGESTPGTNTLLAPWWAGMSADLVLRYRPVADVVSDYTANLTRLAQAGGRFFILPNIPPLYLDPAFNNDYARSLDYQDINARMDQAIQRIQNDHGVTVFRFDFAGLCSNIMAKPTAYGLTNLTGAANACVQCDPNKYMWWDGKHPTTVFHRVIGDATYRCLTPLLIATCTSGPAEQLTIQWQSGSPPYRLQHCNDLVTGAWQSGDVTCETSVALTLCPSPQFFRVLQLGQ